MKNKVSEDLPFVSKEQALKLKQAGFDWITDYVYFTNRSDRLIDWYLGSNINAIRNSDGDNPIVSAPVIHIALKWFREFKNNLIVIDNYTSGYSFEIKNCPPYIPTVFYKDKSKLGYKSYEDAEIAALDYLLNV